MRSTPAGAGVGVGTSAGVGVGLAPSGGVGVGAAPGGGVSVALAPTVGLTAIETIGWIPMPFGACPFPCDVLSNIAIPVIRTGVFCPDCGLLVAVNFASKVARA